jgi:ubiquinone/menaquinone biosynthesis C-methylase UbiE
MNTLNESKNPPTPTFPSGGVHKYVTGFFTDLLLPLNAKALDCPAGDGRASYLLKNKGAEVHAYDLYPEFFKVNGASCRRADMLEGFPDPDASFDFAICEEGIEHVPDQLKVLRDFNRVLKKGGGLLITTPSLSHYRARLSFLLGETEYYKNMPPSEVDSIWYSKRDEKIYYGHVFLLTAQKLRTLAAFAGFEVAKVCWTDIGATSVLMMPLVYPFTVIFNFIAYLRACKGRTGEARKILKEVLLLNLNPKILLSKHHMFYLKKKYNVDECMEHLKQFSL